MNNNLTISEQNLRLTAAYHQMNNKGRDVLDMVIQKLARIKWRVEKDKTKVRYKKQKTIHK